VVGRILALDVGDVRIGVAASDPLGITAQPHSVVAAVPADAAVQAIADLVGELGAQYIVAGLPLTKRGEEGPQAVKVRAFTEKLAGAVDVEIVLQDERFTTVLVERAMAQAGVNRKKRKLNVDMLAAQQILQTHLDRRAATGGTSA
jgi:putative holliday junction resolvase